MMGTHVFQRTPGSWILLALVLATAPAAARAEGFLDIYFGAAFPQDNEVDVDTDDPALNSATASPDGATFRAAYPEHGNYDWETSPSLGIRGGYWFEFEEIPSFLGIGLDLSNYGAFEDTDFAEINVWATPMTPLLMLRLPLGYSEEFPGGRVQPYVAVGPGFTISAASADLSNLGIGMDDFEDVSFDVGLDARAGLAVQLSRGFALFGEYRYTYLEPHFDDTVDDAGGTGFETDVDIEPELATHHIVFGASFRF